MTSGDSAFFEPPEAFNMADYFLDARVREGRGDRTAIVCGDRRVTYSQVQALANRARSALETSGIGMEDRVLILLPDGIEFAAAWFGIVKAGAVFCMASPLGTRDDFEYLLAYTKARGVVAHASTLDRLGDVATASKFLRAKFVVGGSAPGWTPWDDALAKASDATANAPTTRDDLAGWLFTSGTTGKPKGAVHFHHDFPWNTERYAKRVLGLRESDVFVSVSRLFFGYATGTNLMFPFAVGGTAVLFPDKPTPEKLFEEIARNKVTVLTNVPSMIRAMLDSPACASADLTTVRMCLSAGEALPAELFDRWNARFPRAEILDGIGSAELFHIYISNYPGDAAPGRLGKLVPGYDAKICGPEGDLVPTGELGRLWIRGDSSALCYWADQAKTKDVFRGEWVVSADLFRQDERGYFFYAGRADDTMKVRGMFVSPLEVEDALASHAAVRECAVVPSDDGAGLTVPKAFVVLHDGFSASATLAAELVDHVKGRIAKYKAPHAVEFREALPRNDRGKIVRRALS